MLKYYNLNIINLEEKSFNGMNFKTSIGLKITDNGSYHG